MYINFVDFSSAYCGTNQHLKGMFQEKPRQERFETTKSLNACKMTPGTSVNAHVLKMKGLINHLDKLGASISHELVTDLILGHYLNLMINFLCTTICTIWRNLLPSYMEC